MRQRGHSVSLLYFLLSILVACGDQKGVGTSVGNPAYFPSQLAVASPFEVSLQGLTSSSVRVSESQTGFESSIDQIESVLNGTTFDDCRFDPELFFTAEGDASCYGPLVAYENHPDASGPGDPLRSGTLPVGDVGFWSETDEETGHACAASQLNARLKVVEERSLGALLGVASVVCVSKVSGLELPQNASMDLTSQMNDLMIPNVSFTQATFTHASSSQSEEWRYEVALTYLKDEVPLAILIELVHQPGSSDDAYRGRLSYRINDVMDMARHCQTTEQTYNGSLLYSRESSRKLTIEARAAPFCGHDADGLTEGLADPSKKYDSVAEPNGWGNFFDIFTADFDSSTMNGNYAYAWQAGYLESHARVFNVSVTSDNDQTRGEAFYGFGDDIAETTGAIRGFFCNWAGPNGAAFQVREPESLAQYQSVVLNPLTAKFEVSSSQITYVPVNSCEYDGLQDFRYDSDGDGTIDTDPDEPISHDLISLIDGDGDGLFDAIEATGFVLPISPSNL